MRAQRLVSSFILSAVVCVPWAANAQNAPKSDIGPPEVSGAVQHDVSPRLSDMPSVPGNAPGDKEKQLRLIPRGLTAHQNDPIVQSSVSSYNAPTAGLNIPGVGNGDYGFVPNAAPPDTNGAVGATQYVQWVNESFAVFDKTTGAIASGFPKTGNTLWSGFGGGCQNNNDGDPVVQYDKAANRWILTQFSVSTTPYLQCVAVSTSSDATGTYNRYAFQQPNFNDYPKLGVWPDGYYISFNMFSGNTFVGGRACAFDRTAMLAGTAATQICFQLTSTYGGLLPSDLDGSTPPPAGSPNYFLAFGNDSQSMDMWKFHTDFGTPANATITHVNFAVAPFAAACGGGGTCIPQLSTTQQLDSLADRLMHRLAYRNFGDHESLVVNHSVTASPGTNVGVRWYEIQSPNSNPFVSQSGTYAPDSSSRWMGSIAMDHSGNIALGYSVSSSSLYPAIRYAIRTPSDPAGTLEAETSIKEGGGAQSGNRLSRWGDYSAMTIDPSDDCTFFYTNEYEKTTGSFNWSTQIASFKIPGCGSTVPDIAIAQVSVPSPTYVNTTYNVMITVQNVGGTAAGSFSVSLADGTNPTTSGSQTVSSLAAGATTTLTFTWTPTASGSHTLTATATPPTGETNTANNSLSVNSNVATRPDIAISSVSAPATTAVNTANNVVVNVTNGGGAAGSFSVSLKDSAGATISAAQNVSSLGAGASTNLTFTWTPTVSGAHTLTATATSPTGETNTANNSNSANSTVSGASADFTLSMSPASANVKRGKSASYTVTISPVNGFNGPVALSFASNPAGLTGNFNPSPATTTSTLTVNTSSTTPPGSYTLTVTGQNGTLSHSTSATLTVR